MSDTSIETHEAAVSWRMEAARAVVASQSAAWTAQSLADAGYRGSMLIQPGTGDSLRRQRLASKSLSSAAPDPWLEYAAERRKHVPPPQPLWAPHRWPLPADAYHSIATALLTPRDRIMAVLASTPDNPLFVLFSTLRNRTIVPGWLSGHIELALVQLCDEGIVTEVNENPSVLCIATVASQWGELLSAVTDVFDADQMKLPDGNVGYYDVQGVGYRILAALPRLTSIPIPTVEAICATLAYREVLEAIWLDAEGTRPGMRPKQGGAPVEPTAP